MTDYKREAERLRIVVQTFAHAHPDMSLEEATPLIFAAERRSAELEGPVTAPKTFTLPSRSPHHVAMWIELTPHVQKLITDGKTVLAVKETHDICGTSLKESKEGVFFWRENYGKTGMADPLTAAAISEWIDTQPDIRGVLTDCRRTLPRREINATAKVYLYYPFRTSLRQAQKGVEFWMDQNL